MENNNRTILAIALIVLLWSGYSMFFAPQPPPAPPASETASTTAAEPAAGSEIFPAARLEEPLQGSTPLPADYRERLISVSSDLYRLEFSTTGATLRSVELKQYRASNGKNAEAFMYKELGEFKFASYKTSGSEGLAIPTDLPYQMVAGADSSILVGDEKKVVTFTATTASGLTVNKSYIFYPDSYQIDVQLQLANTSDQALRGAVNLALVSELGNVKGEGMQDMYTFLGPLSFDGEELLEDDLDDLEKSAKIYNDSIIWSGFVEKYFLNILAPQDSAKQVQVQKGEGFVENRFVSPFINLEAGQQQSFDYVSFIGPKDFDLLQGVGYSFERAKDFGFFRFLAKPLLHVLKFFYGFLGNYGFAIILLTVCIKLIFWPLTQKSYKSMKGMQKLQPEMQKMREKYGHDKQRLNQEMMSFYKDNKVNPLGGCLPMLIQIPVFFALYQVLLGAIELRHAPFMLWITDLSMKDPYYVTPLIMGVTMFLQQKMTPTNMDPTQAKIMLMMPVVFTFLFLNFPAGLVIYWLVNNLLTILQQYLIKRQPD